MSIKINLIEEKIITKKECLHGYRFCSRELLQSLHPNTIPKKIRYLKKGSRTVESLNKEEIVIDIFSDDWRGIEGRPYQSVPSNYHFAVLIRDVGYVHTKKIPVNYPFTATTSWYMKELSIVEKNYFYISLKITVAGGEGFEEELVLKIWLKHTWTDFIRLATRTYLKKPVTERYQINYARVDNSKFKLWIQNIKRPEEIIFSEELSENEDNIRELATRIMSSDVGTKRSESGPFATFDNPKSELSDSNLDL